MWPCFSHVKCVSPDVLLLRVGQAWHLSFDLKNFMARQWLLGGGRYSWDLSTWTIHSLGKWSKWGFWMTHDKLKGRIISLGNPKGPIALNLPHDLLACPGVWNFRSAGWKNYGYCREFIGTHFSSQSRFLLESNSISWWHASFVPQFKPVLYKSPFSFLSCPNLTRILQSTNAGTSIAKFSKEQ